MEQTTAQTTVQAFNAMLLIIPVLLAAVPGFLFYSGYRLSAKEKYAFTSNSLFWLGGHGVTLVLATLFTLTRGSLLPDMVVLQLPLVLTVCYLAAAVATRSSLVLSIALATPGIWLFCIKCWQAFSGSTEMLYSLPQDPFWYLLAAAVLFGLKYKAQMQRIWDTAEAVLIPVSGGYLIGGLWLLALGQQSLLAVLGVPPYGWAIILLAAASLLLWCANLMRDAVFAGCGLLGLMAGVYTFVTRYPW